MTLFRPVLGYFGPFLGPKVKKFWVSCLFGNETVVGDPAKELSTIHTLVAELLSKHMLPPAEPPLTPPRGQKGLNLGPKWIIVVIEPRQPDFLDSYASGWIFTTCTWLDGPATPRQARVIPARARGVSTLNFPKGGQKSMFFENLLERGERWRKNVTYRKIALGRPHFPPIAVFSNSTPGPRYS